MPGIVIVAHQPLASALLSVSEHILGHPVTDCIALDVEAGDCPETVQHKIDDAIHHLPASDVIVLSDIVGATPANGSAALMSDSAHHSMRCCHISGVNLPMLLRTLQYRDLGLETVVAKAIEGGRGGVMPLSPPPLPTSAPPLAAAASTVAVAAPTAAPTTP